MAIGTLTPVAQLGGNPGAIPQKIAVVDIVGPASYTTGGDTITAAEVGLSRIVAGWVNVSAMAAAGVTTKCYGGTILPQSDGSAKLFLFQQGSTASEGQEVGSAGDVAGVTLRCFLVGV